MKSRWYELKKKVIALRKQGFSMNAIERKFGIARSTLSGWFKKVELTPTQKKRLIQKATGSKASAPMAQAERVCLVRAGAQAVRAGLPHPAAQNHRRQRVAGSQTRAAQPHRVLQTAAAARARSRDLQGVEAVVRFFAPHVAVRRQKNSS